MFLSKRIITVAIVVILIIVGFVYFTQGKKELEPIVTYKAVQPDKKKLSPKGDGIPLNVNETGRALTDGSQEHNKGLSEVPTDDDTTDKESDFFDEFLESIDDAEIPFAEDVAEDVPVSPFGFGPYPEVPDGLRASLNYLASWEEDDWPNFPDARKFELMDRVLIKLWNEGDQSWEGAGTRGDKLYPTYPNTIYVWYGEAVRNPDGTFTTPFVEVDGMTLSQEQLRLGQAPPGVTVLDGETEGIDMYEYLNLP